MTHILLVEDEPAIGQPLQAALTSQTYTVSWVRAGSDAMAPAYAHSPDLVLLDLGLPDLDGNQVCRHLRAAHPGAIIVILTARDSEIDVIVGLEAGADDYLVKPLRLTELLARIRAHLRRSITPTATAAVLTIGALRVDVGARRAWVAERELTLRAKEFDLLARLAAQPGQVVTRETLMAEVWDENWFGSTKTLDVHIAALRRKLALDAAPAHDMSGSSADGRGGAGTVVVATLRGRGYRLQRESG